MPRRKIGVKSVTIDESPESNSSDLKSLVESYITHKDLENENKKLASEENNQIKSIMTEQNLETFDSDLGTIKLSERVNESFDENALIEFLKSKGCAKKIVKMKEYVDFEALESAIYHEDIPVDTVKEMDKCKIKKVTQELRIKKKKG